MSRPPPTDAPIYYTYYPSPYGDILLAGTERGLCSLVLSPISEAQLLGPIRERSGVNLLRDDASFERASRFLAGYFEGSKADFQGELDLRGTTPFQAKVWSVLRQIPHGETRSYAWVATRLGEADSARAVGQVVGQNPIPIIVPCHRVVHEDGSLGGFSGGLHWKKRLLALERGQSGFF